MVKPSSSLQPEQRQAGSGRITGATTGIGGHCTFVSLEGHSLKLESEIPFALRAFVKVEDGNRMWMGEVWACEPGPGGFSILVDARMCLNDVASVERLASRFRHGRARQAILPGRDSPNKIA